MNKTPASKPDHEDKRTPPLAQGVDTSEAVSGGPEDLMVQDLGGTLPLKDSQLPHYYSKDSSSKKTGG